jgi:uncharacterized membrane protein required for colicin V production
VAGDPGRLRHEGGRVDFGEWLNSLNIVDVVIAIALFGMFVVGFVQGAVRRGVGILTMTFSFFLAGQLNQWLGKFLAENWVQYPPLYSYMIGYLILFFAGVIAFAVVVQTTYRKVAIFARWPILDEVLGGVLGVIWALLLLMFTVTILGTYFLAAPVGDADEMTILRDVWNALYGSAFGQFLVASVIPIFVAWTSFLLPESVTAVYRGG